MDKPTIPTQQIIDELTAVCNSLGKIDENDGTYMKDRECKACLREMQRYLNIDGEMHVARCTLGSLNVVKSDLIPILVQYCDYTEGDPELFTTILRLCTNLTSSALLLFENQEIPTEPELLKVYHKIMTSLYRYKEAFALDDKIWEVLNVHLRHNTDEEVTFERLIVLLRNILHVPVDSTGDFGNHGYFDAHDMCLFRMDKSGMLNTLMDIASESQKGSEYCFHIMEVIYLMLRDQSPTTIAQARPNILKRKLDDTDEDKKRLAELSRREKRERQQRMKFIPPRFKATSFVVQNCRSLGNAPLVINKPLGSIDSIKFDEGKTELRKAKNRKPLSSETSMKISDLNTRTSKISYSLRQFCKRFVEKVYNDYMQQIKNNLIQKRAQENDETYYLWAIQFFTSFNRELKLSLDNISETISTSSLHFIQILINNYQDKIKMEKKKFEDISKRLHLALRAYREILSLINCIDQESEFYRTIENIRKNIFTENEYNSLLLNLLQQYDEPKHSIHYLKDLIKTNDIFIDMMEKFSMANVPIDQEEPEPTEEAVEAGKEGEEKVDEPEKEGDTRLHVDAEAKQTKARRKRRKKAEYKTAHFISRYCCPDVLRSYMSVLKEFKTNEESLNLIILKFLERIVYDCQYDLMLCQASVFKCFLNIMDYDSSMPGHAKFVELGKHLMQSFGSKANKKRWMFQELLFWKTPGDVLEIENSINPPETIAFSPPPAKPLETDDLPESMEVPEPPISPEPPENENANEPHLAESPVEAWSELESPSPPPPIEMGDDGDEQEVPLSGIESDDDDEVIITKKRSHHNKLEDDDEVDDMDEPRKISKAQLDEDEEEEDSSDLDRLPTPELKSPVALMDSPEANANDASQSSDSSLDSLLQLINEDS